MTRPCLITAMAIAAMGSTNLAEDDLRDQHQPLKSQRSLCSNCASNLSMSKPIKANPPDTDKFESLL